MARSPKTQRHILSILEQSHSLSAPALLARLESEGAKVNKTTVYRALEKLIQEGRLCRQVFSNDSLVYELRDNHHDHAVCEACGTVSPIPCTTPQALELDGFIPSHHHMTIFGLCHDCSLLKKP